MESYNYKTYQGPRMRYRAEQKARQKRRRIARLRTFCGAAAFVFFLLVLGKAGESDLGAPLEQIIPSTLFYMAGFAVSALSFDYLDQFR